MINPWVLLSGIRRKASFKFSILTSAPSETFTLPLLSGTHNFTVNWGDGTADNIITAFENGTLTYSEAMKRLNDLVNNMGNIPEELGSEFKKTIDSFYNKLNWKKQKL